MKVRTFFSNAGSWLLKACLDLLDFLIWLFLTIVAAVLLPVIAVIAIVYYLVTLPGRKLNAGEILSGGGISFKWISIGIDHLANIIGGPFFNWFFLVGDTPFPFGVPGESLSEILGWNEAISNNNRKGRACIAFLDLFEKDHCYITWNKALMAAKHKIDRAKAIREKYETATAEKEFIKKYS